MSNRKNVLVGQGLSSGSPWAKHGLPVIFIWPFLTFKICAVTLRSEPNRFVPCWKTFKNNKNQFLLPVCILFARWMKKKKKKSRLKKCCSLPWWREKWTVKTVLWRNDRKISVSTLWNLPSTLVCSICSECMAVTKEYNLRRRFKTKHVNFDTQYPSGSDARRLKVQSLTVD